MFRRRHRVDRCGLGGLYELSCECATAFSVEGCAFSGRCSVRVGYYVSQVFVAMDCSKGNASAFDGVNEDVAVEYGS